MESSRNLSSRGAACKAKVTFRIPKVGTRHVASPIDARSASDPSRDPKSHRAEK